jgi:hypothetical protein
MKRGKKLAICALTFLATSCGADSSQNSNGSEDIAGLSDIMQRLVEPSVDTIWNSVSFTADESGSKQNSPQSEEDCNACAMQPWSLVKA